MPNHTTESLIPRKVFFGNPDVASPRLSPDGTRMSYLRPVDGVLNIWVGPANDHAAAKPVTDNRTRGIRNYFWSYSSEHILYLLDNSGDENWRVYSIDLISLQTRDLTPIEGVSAQIQTVSPNIPGEIVIGMNDRNPQFHDLYRVNIASGDRHLIQRNEEFAGFLIDAEYTVRFAYRMMPDGGSETLIANGKSGWELFMKVSMEDLLTTTFEGFDKSGRVLYMRDSRGRDTASMATINLDTGQESIIAEDPRADLSDVMVHPTERHVEAVAFTYERKQWQILDASIAADIEHLRTVANGDMEVVSRTLDDKYWIVAYIMDDGPVRYYRYEREKMTATFLFTNRKDLEGLTLSKMHSSIIRSRDQLDLVTYYTLPIWSDINGRPTHPLPMVLVVHGGPWGRDQWGYAPWHQMLANRGYVAISINFRGSTGLGKRFVNAGNMEWGGKMHDDLIDAVHWAIEEKIADPDRIAITGGSYGGYATLVGLTLTPDIFACGVDLVGPSNLVTLIESIPPYWQPLIELFATRVGDHRTEEGRALLNQRSPLNYVDRIKRPLLICQGANDPRVKQTESDQIVQAMREKNIPVTYAIYHDEGHGFVRPENTLSFFAIAEAFLGHHLGGQVEPIGNDFDGSTIDISLGTEHIPGLINVQHIPSND